MRNLEALKNRIQLLEMQIKLNRMLPPHLRCEDAIDKMKFHVAVLRRRLGLKPVRN
jgi:hypothetical protein